ncbi:polysaccharide deacetylase family protein, partial [Aneurinibacillus tyrosinisolvens]|uniref:polysaccharide deacetylase family protein n=1 Tax=Aneurinibacillus tyrosinisolvens TaxID=1443435 RepID=UPI00063F2191
MSSANPSPIYQGSPDKPVISFMVNVAWGNEYLPQLLEILHSRGIKLTFFLQGSWVARFPELARKISAAGHEIGNHAYTHPDMRSLSADEIYLELRKTNEVIGKELGLKPKFFTPPYGYYDGRVIDLAARESMLTILWTLDTLDWKMTDSGEIFRRIIPHLRNGSLILMHPTESSMKALPAMLDAAREKSYEIGTVSEVLSVDKDLLT